MAYRQVRGACKLVRQPGPREQVAVGRCELEGGQRRLYEELALGADSWAFGGRAHYKSAWGVVCSLASAYRLALVGRMLAWEGHRKVRVGCSLAWLEQVVCRQVWLVQVAYTQV